MTTHPGHPPVPPADAVRLVRPASPAHVIRSDAEAIELARTVAADLTIGAAERDRTRAAPLAELDRYSQSGLWAIRIPRDRGGAEVSFTTVAEVVATISAADPSIAQIGQSHVGLLHAIQIVGSKVQQDHWLPQILSGLRIGNAAAEFGRSFTTRLSKRSGTLMLNGRKFYATGTLFAHLVAVVALDDDGRRTVVLLDRDTPGLIIIDDWDSFGQRTTASGTVLLEDIQVEPEHVLPVHLGFGRFPAGAISQIVHVAIDVGIARAAIADGIRFVREDARPARDTGVEQAWQDPYTIQTVGDLEIRLHAAEALLERAGKIVDQAWASPDADAIAAASIAVAEAKVMANDIALLAGSTFFELAGTRSTLAPHAFDRHWRNARSHTVHDPVRWKRAAIGNFYLNGVKPILGGQI